MCSHKLTGKVSTSSITHHHHPFISCTIELSRILSSQQRGQKYRRVNVDKPSELTATNSHQDREQRRQGYRWLDIEEATVLLQLRARQVKISERGSIGFQTLFIPHNHLAINHTQYHRYHLDHVLSVPVIPFHSSSYHCHHHIHPPSSYPSTVIHTN